VERALAARRAKESVKHVEQALQSLGGGILSTVNVEISTCSMGISLSNKLNNAMGSGKA
jgi:hypothetical protein